MPSIAIAFSVMKQEIEALVQKYGTDGNPPAEQIFTIANRPTRGNAHLVQKVFQGAFEVRVCIPSPVVRH